MKRKVFKVFFKLIKDVLDLLSVVISFNGYKIPYGHLLSCIQCSTSISRDKHKTSLTLLCTLADRFDRLLEVLAFRPPRVTDENGSQSIFRKSKYFRLQKSF